MRRRGREDIEDAAAHRELAAARDHVDPVVGQLDEAERDGAQIVPASADDQVDRRHVGETGRQRLDRAADRRRHDQRRLAVPAGDAPEHVEPAADDLGARAQALVGQRLPRREVHHLGAGHQGPQRGADRLGPAAGRSDQQDDGRLAGCAAALDEGGEQRRVEAFDQREVGIDGCCGDSILKRLCLFEGAHDPGNCHRMSLRAAADTRTRVVGRMPRPAHLIG
jgi:hypothetical protein